MIAVLVLGSACATQAQDEDDKKIKIKITKMIDGEMQTFEGEYRNEEEMRNDPNYQKFSGEDGNMAFFFGGDNDFPHVIDLHRGPGAQAFSFGFDDDDMKKLHKNFKFRHGGQGGPSAFWFGDDDAAVFDFKSWDSEEFEKELAEKMKELEEKMEGLDSDLQKQIMESLKEIEGLHSEKGFPRRIHRSGVSVSDVEDDFGKRGKVDKKDLLELDDINYIVMRNQLTLRFRTPEEGELTVKISNEAGKDIYNRYFESFGGRFSDSIDFSKYSDGKYLLEIQLDKKRLTKKIVID